MKNKARDLYLNQVADMLKGMGISGIQIEMALKKCKEANNDKAMQELAMSNPLFRILSRED